MGLRRSPEGRQELAPDTAQYRGGPDRSRCRFHHRGCIKREGDAKAATIYAQAVQHNPEFYSFYRSMEAYRASFRNTSDVLVVEPNSDFFRYLRDSAGKGGGSRK